MASHEPSLCPRCGKEFECRVGSVSLCQCASIELNNSQREFIAGLYDDCLCAGCLVALRDEYDMKIISQASTGR